MGLKEVCSRFLKKEKEGGKAREADESRMACSITSFDPDRVKRGGGR